MEAGENESGAHAERRSGGLSDSCSVAIQRVKSAGEIGVHRKLNTALGDELDGALGKRVDNFVKFSL